MLAYSTATRSAPIPPRPHLHVVLAMICSADPLRPCTQEEADSCCNVFSPPAKRRRINLETAWLSDDADSECGSPGAVPAPGHPFDDTAGNFRDGIGMADIFTPERGTASASKQRPLQRTPPSKLGACCWSDLIVMHPNRIFALVCEYVLPRLREPAAELKRLKKKQWCWRHWVGRLLEDPHSQTELALNARARYRARTTLLSWLARLTGQSTRDIARDLVKAQTTWYMEWHTLPHAVKVKWALMMKLFMEQEVRDRFPELFGGSRRERISAASTVATASEEQAKPGAVTAYGFSATYNTDIGLKDSTILGWIQQGITGPALQRLLVTHPALKASFEAFREYIFGVAKRLGFATVAVAMEHSAHGNHPARVHLHAYAGVDIRGGVGWMPPPKGAVVDQSMLKWKDCAAPRVRLTLVRRPSPSMVFSAVAYGVYYVVGGKSGGLFRDATLWPFKDSFSCWCVLHVVVPHVA